MEFTTENYTIGLSVSVIYLKSKRLQQESFVCVEQIYTILQFFSFKNLSSLIFFLFEGLPISWSDIAKSTRKQHQCNLCDRRSKQQIGKESLLR